MLVDFVELAQGNQAADLCSQQWDLVGRVEAGLHPTDMHPSFQNGRRLCMTIQRLQVKPQPQ